MKENINTKTNKPIGLKNNVLVQELEKELLLYDLTRDKVFCLNETSLMVWNLCDGENSVEDIQRKLSVQLKTPVNEEVIWLALDKLKSERLLSNYQEIEINFNGLSRREVIKKAGLATMIALLLIMTITSPIPPLNLKPSVTRRLLVFVLMRRALRSEVLPCSKMPALPPIAAAPTVAVSARFSAELTPAKDLECAD